ncbi:hypothetical protein MNV49_001638 [Pseudohyphozyma bogoriensis]|nr:hypothetical protein MNV49_001638 [Pseudohyphozyma bogoriensis]
MKYSYSLSALAAILAAPFFARAQAHRASSESQFGLTNGLYQPPTWIPRPGSIGVEIKPTGPATECELLTLDWSGENLPENRIYHFDVEAVAEWTHVDNRNQSHVQTFANMAFSTPSTSLAWKVDLPAGARVSFEVKLILEIPTNVTQCGVLELRSTGGEDSPYWSVDIEQNSRLPNSRPAQRLRFPINHGREDRLLPWTVRYPLGTELVARTRTSFARGNAATFSQEYVFKVDRYGPSDCLVIPKTQRNLTGLCIAAIVLSSVAIAIALAFGVWQLVRFVKKQRGGDIRLPVDGVEATTSEV